MAPYVETAVQWLHDAIRCQILARRSGVVEPPSGEWVSLCWEVGHSLAMMQAHGIPAQPVIEEVSKRLVAEFGPEGDYTPWGLRTMRQFYLDYFERPQLQPLLKAVDWDCHKLILSLCRDPAQQEFYLEAVRAESMDAEALGLALKERRYELGPAAPKAPVPQAFGKKAKSPAKGWGGKPRKGTGNGTTSITR